MKTAIAHLLLVVCVLFGVNGETAAQSFPDKPLRLIIPFPPGGGSDVVGRIIAQALSTRLGQQVEVDNRSGAGGSIGTEAAVRSAPDGYTMVLASSSEVAINPHLYKLAYDTIKDLTPVVMVASTPIVVVVDPALPVKTIGDLIAYARANPGAVNVASAGNGSITHLSGELFRSMTKVNWAHVPYKGAAPAITDLMGGRVQVMFSALPAAMPAIKGERIRAIAVSTRARAPGLPDVPTIAESGVPDYDVMFWYGLFVPAGTPQDVADKLYSATAEVLKSREVVKSLADQGAQPGAMTRVQFADFVRAEEGVWGKVVRESGAKVD